MKIKTMNIKKILPCGLMLLLAGCGPSTKIEKTWTDPSFTKESVQSVKKVLVMGLLNDESTRRIAEDKMVAAFKNVTAVQSYSYLSASDTDRNAVEAKLKQDGFDGVIGTTASLASIPPKMQICQSIVLPVSVLSFNANYTAANTVDVKWTTTHEIDADYYEVQRSVNGAPFEPIGRVDASQSSDPIHAYIFNDQLYNVSSGTVYYQLRIVDKDGKFDFSKVVAVKIGEPEKAISVYPNPVDNHATLNLYTDKPVTGVIRLFDNAGKQIFNRPFSAGSGSNSISIDQLGNLARGIYIIQVVYDNNLFNQKLIKK